MTAAPTPGAHDNVDTAMVDELVKLAQSAVSRGDLPSLQFALAHRGKLLAFETFGTIKCRGEQKGATNDTLYVAFSTTKAVVAVAAWLLIEDGKLNPAEKVADIVPAFVKGGKGSGRV